MGYLKKKIFTLLSILLIILFSSFYDRALPLIPSKESFTLVELLGKSLEDATLKGFMFELKETPEIANYALIDKRTYYSYKRNGIAFLFMEKKLDTIFLYSEGHEGFNQYRGSIYNRIVLSDDREAIRGKLGNPSKEEALDKSPQILKDILRGSKIATWDKWLYPHFIVTVNYSKDGKIVLISIGRNTPDKK